MKTPTQSTTQVKTQHCMMSEQTGVCCSAASATGMQAELEPAVWARRTGGGRKGRLEGLCREAPTSRGLVRPSADKGKTQRGLASVLISLF